MEAIEAVRLHHHLHVLTEQIGIRLAGTAGEAAAQRYIAAAFAELNAEVTEESFPVRCREVLDEELQVRIGDQWQRFPASLFSSTPGTDGQVLEAPIVVFEAAAEYGRDTLEHLRGKAVVHLGCHIESREHYRRLMAAGPAFILMVDTRYPGTVALADGMFPAYTSSIGAVPTLNVAYWDAWQWLERGADQARIRVKGGMKPSLSANVIADLPGSQPGEVIYIGAHHDTQAGSVGADDNGSGVVGLLELARVLAPMPRKRTLRFISFGAEEQLSVGSAHHVREHRAEVAEQGALIFNLDSYGSMMGWTTLVCNGPEELEQQVAAIFAEHGQYARRSRELVPYADHFPFVAAGIPGIWMGRANCAGGRFFHHRPDDLIRRLSLPRMASLLDAAAAVLGKFATAEELPFPIGVPLDQKAQVEACWEDLFGGWSPPPIG